MNLAVNADMSGIKTSADTLGFYGILGAVSVAFFALIILFRRK